jgi:pyruvate/2-oxoglutarate dehydrogenase complex dihydrolipoamide acyltransferase (E2) component
VIQIRAPSHVFQDVDEGVEGLLEGWLVSEGDVVHAGQPLADAIVVKTSFQVVAPADGRIGSILVGEGETFGPGAELATLQEEAAAAAAAAAATSDAVAKGVPLSGMRGAVAREMAGAWRHPRVAVGVEVEMTAALARRDALQQEAGHEPHLSPTHLVLRAVALELREHPRLNARIGEEAVELAADVNLGLAVNLDEGVIVPVIRDADRKSVPELAREAGELAAAARAGTLPGAALRDGTFTLSTLGATGIDWFTPILNAPQVGILGVGAIAERVVARGGDPVVAPTMVLTLVFDHRAVDGYVAALLLAAVRDRLERAEL